MSAVVLVLGNASAALAAKEVVGRIVPEQELGRCAVEVYFNCGCRCCAYKAKHRSANYYALKQFLKHVLPPN
jgi:hypothetical protein